MKQSCKNNCKKSNFFILYDQRICKLRSSCQIFAKKGHQTYKKHKHHVCDHTYSVKVPQRHTFVITRDIM